MSKVCQPPLLDIFIAHVSDKAKEAMLKEVRLTPKPGLVDLHNSGSHNDMDAQTFYESIEAIAPFLKAFINAGIEGAYDEPTVLFLELRALGQACEKAMFEATKGVNTHKGMIFSQAVILGSVGRVVGRGKRLCYFSLQEEIKQVCTGLIARDFKVDAQTAGERFYQETRHGGIRQEAQNGYPTLFDVALPNFQTYHRLYGEDIALKKTLLLLISHLNDTTIWSRGGVEGLYFAKEKAQHALLVPNDTLEQTLHALDEAFIARHLSPGGSADMLAMTWLVSQLCEVS